MTIAFVLGNGLSRKGIGLNDLKQRGKVYGCNALYREFTPDVLVATDKPIATRIQEIGYPAKNKFYTRRPIEGLGARVVPKQYFGFSSGPIATGIAAIDGHTHIYLVGFDMGPNEEQKFNNIYADTEFYKTSQATPTFTGNWVRQLVQISKDYPNTAFYRICGKTTARLSDLDSLSNFYHIDLTSFLDRINNQKDL